MRTRPAGCVAPPIAVAVAVSHHCHGLGDAAERPSASPSRRRDRFGDLVIVLAGGSRPIANATRGLADWSASSMSSLATGPSARRAVRASDRSSVEASDIPAW